MAYAPLGVTGISRLKIVEDTMLDPYFMLIGTRYQGIPETLRELMFTVKFKPGSFIFTVVEIADESFEPRLNSCAIMKCLQPDQ